MNETKLRKIKNNLINKSPLNLEKMKKKINYINYILQQLTLQNFHTTPSDLQNCYDNNINSYKNQINTLNKLLMNSSFPQNINMKSNNTILTPPGTPVNQSTNQLTEIKDTPERIIQNVKTFYKRSIRTDVLNNLKFFSTFN
ncbi:unnamed protein product [Macrosiphum euphorbiae]|uniref:Uncharacterized protein n=1 Tax=Macrosiphum euphorbiae TaxID=13131 RepID=A0AAV0Y941_9HEMI|nr:unnamed protein product [Macrosiphum euphorbiae]CAI6377460.1 unnamed protein product [Macrosiphum euphorbiae]